MAKKEEIFTVSTPFSGVQTATLYQNIWDDHITAGHAEMVGQEKVVAKALRGPTFVCAGNDVGEFGFIDQTDVDTEGRPAVVFVSTNVDDGKPLVTTAFRGRKGRFMDKSKFRIVWP